jgi:AraC-like DNA-binding protein
MKNQELYLSSDPIKIESDIASLLVNAIQSSNLGEQIKMVIDTKRESNSNIKAIIKIEDNTGRIAEVFFDLSREISKHKTSENKEDTEVSADEKILNRITRLIEESLTDPDLNVSRLCQKSGLGNKMVYRKVKDLTGMSIVEYIRYVRLKKAAVFLQQQKLSVSETLYMVGFSNHSYFTRCFKNEYGMSPKEFVEKKIELLNCSIV